MSETQMLQPVNETPLIISDFTYQVLHFARDVQAWYQGAVRPQPSPPDERRASLEQEALATFAKYGDWFSQVFIAERAEPIAICPKANQAITVMLQLRGNYLCLSAFDDRTGSVVAGVVTHLDHNGKTLVRTKLVDPSTDVVRDDVFALVDLCPALNQLIRGLDSFRRSCPGLHKRFRFTEPTSKEFARFVDLRSAMTREMFAQAYARTEIASPQVVNSLSEGVYQMALRHEPSQILARASRFETNTIQFLLGNEGHQVQRLAPPPQTSIKPYAVRGQSSFTTVTERAHVEYVILGSDADTTRVLTDSIRRGLSHIYERASILPSRS